MNADTSANTHCGSRIFATTAFRARDFREEKIEMKANHKIAALREIAVKAIAFGLCGLVGIGIGFANLYADEDGETHFRDIKIEPASERPGGKVSGRFPATGIIFRTTEGNYNYDWHTAPQKQYVINLDAAVKVTASDGEWRVVFPGEILLVEDTRGRGHVSQAVDSKFRHSVFVTLD
jgi:hypothetical protein